MKKTIVAILMAALLSLGLASAVADAWNAGDTVYFHVNAKAGGGTDLYTRYLTQALGEVCPGVNFVVNNYETSEVGMATVINAKPDGYNLGTCHGGAIIQWYTGSSNINLKDQAKIVGIMNLGGPQAIIAGPNAPYKNFTELAEFLKANPGYVMIGCSLGGTTQMIFTSFVEAIAGDKDLAMYVQCASEADKLTNVASGSIDIANCSIPNALSYEADGRLTILGTIGPKMSTIASMSELLGTELGSQYASGPEQGVESATWDSNYYVYAPAGTPDEVCQAINEAICKASEAASFVEGNKAMATFVAPVNLEDTQAAFTTEWEFLDGLVAGLGLKTR
jgi:tripartite-type tricarboxylate transporter receptor subunit TctC